MTVSSAPSPSARSGLRSIATNASYIFIARLGAQVVRGAYVVVLARALGPELYGLLAYGQSWAGAFLPLTVLGFGIVMARQAGRDPAHGRAQAAHMLVLRGVLTLAAAILCAGIGWALNADPAVRLLLGILSLALIGRAAATMAEDIFTAFEAAHLAFRQEAVFRPAEVALGLAVLAPGGGVIEIAAAHAVVQIAQGTRGLVLARRYLAFHPEIFAWRPTQTLLAKGVLAGAVGLLAVWLLQGPLLLYAQGAEDKASIGHLALAMQALGLCCALPWAIGRAALPMLSRASAEPNASHGHFADAMLRLAFVFAGGLALAGPAIGLPLVVRLFGAGYAAAGALLGPALWLLLPLTAATALNPLLMARERYAAAGLSALAGAAVMTLSVALLSAPLGPLGAVAGTAAGACLWAVCLLVLVARRAGLAIRRVVVRPTLAVVVALGAHLAAEGAGAGPSSSLVVAWLALLLAAAGLCMAPAERRAVAAYPARLWIALMGRSR